MPTWTGTTGFDSANFLEMMPDTITFNATTATDKYGKKTFGGANVSVRCRLIDDIVLIKNAEGQDIVAVGRAILAGNYLTLTLGHKLTLPDGRTPVIVKIDSKNDTSATTHHTVVYYGM
jgi:hypothetical protein